MVRSTFLGHSWGYKFKHSVILPKSCYLTWFGGLRAFLILKAIPVGTSVTGDFNRAGQDLDERSDEWQCLALQIGSLVNVPSPNLRSGVFFFQGRHKGIIGRGHDLRLPIPMKKYHY